MSMQTSVWGGTTCSIGFPIYMRPAANANRLSHALIMAVDVTFFSYQSCTSLLLRFGDITAEYP